MPLRLSTGLVNKLMDTGSFKSVFNLSFIDIYTGTQPAAADDAPTGTLLVTISNGGGGTGLTFETNATDGQLEKTANETWTGTAGSAGFTSGTQTAGWFRLRAAGDTGVLSTTQARVDGAIATSGAQMNLGNLTITHGAPFVLSSASFTLPKS